MNLVAVFRSAADYIRAHRWEVPTYAALAGLVTEAFRTVEQQLTTQLAHYLIPARRQLKALFTTPEEAPAYRGESNGSAGLAASPGRSGFCATGPDSAAATQRGWR